MPYSEPTLKELSPCLGAVLYSSISFCWLAGAYFWPFLWRVYFLKRYNTVINLCSLAQNKAHLYKRHVQMIGCCTTGISNIQVCISLTDCILLYLCNSYLNFTAPQCWLTGQFWLVLYNQHNFCRFWENIVIGQFSLSLFFIVII